MGARRRFGCIYPKPNKKNPTSLEASYPVPAWAYEKFADMLEGKKRLSQRFQFDPKDPEDRRQAEADAEAWLNKAEREINRGTWQPPKREAARDLARSITFAQYATAYVENRRQRGKLGGDPIDDSTKAKYRQYLADYLLPQLGNLPMNAISEATLWRFVQSFPIGADGKGKSIRWHVVTLLHGIFKEASTRKLDETGEPLLKTNPAEGVEVERSDPKEPYVDISMAELETLAGAMPCRHAPMIYLIGVMGMRPEEVTRCNEAISSSLTTGGSAGSISAGPARKARTAMEASAWGLWKTIRPARPRQGRAGERWRCLHSSCRSSAATWRSTFSPGPKHGSSRENEPVTSCSRRVSGTHGMRPAKACHASRRRRFASTICDIGR